MSVLAAICLLDFFFLEAFFFLAAVQTFHIKDREKHFHSCWVLNILFFWLFIYFKCCAEDPSTLQSNLNGNISQVYSLFFQLYLGLISSELSVTLPTLTVSWEIVHGLIKTPASGLLGLCAI